MATNERDYLLHIGTIWPSLKNGHSNPRKENQVKKMDSLEMQMWYYALPAEITQDSKKNPNYWKGPVSFAELQYMWQTVK